MNEVSFGSNLTVSRGSEDMTLNSTEFVMEEKTAAS
jgi:hypothetical protein